MARIKFCLNPKFSQQDIFGNNLISSPSDKDNQNLLTPNNFFSNCFTKNSNLDKDSKFVDKKIALNGSEFMPGLVGLNNLKKTDGISVIIHLLNRVKPIRNFLLSLDMLGDERDDKDSLVLLKNLYTNNALIKKLSELLRKMWNPLAFKSHVSPHQFVQAVTIASNKKFVIGTPVKVFVFVFCAFQ